MPTRRANEQYWNEAQFDKLCDRPARQAVQPRPAALAAAGLHARRLAGGRADPPPGRQAADGQRPDRGGPEAARPDADDALGRRLRDAGAAAADRSRSSAEAASGAPCRRKKAATRTTHRRRRSGCAAQQGARCQGRRYSAAPSASYQPMLAHPTRKLAKLLKFRGINPLYGVFLVNQLGIADRDERIQAIESVLEMPGSVASSCACRSTRIAARPAGHDCGSTSMLLRLGLATPEQLGAKPAERRRRPRDRRGDVRGARVGAHAGREAAAAVRLRRFPASTRCRTTPVWAAGELLEFGGDFNKYVTSKQPAEAGRRDLPPPAAADPAAERISAAHAARRGSAEPGRPTCATSPPASRTAAARSIPAAPTKPWKKPLATARARLVAGK